MSVLSSRLEVLRDEALNTAESGPDAPGTEVFDAILDRVAHMHDTDLSLNMSLRDALNRRLAWGEDPSTIIVDSDSVGKRLLSAVGRAFPDPGETASLASIIVEVTCSAARHLARNAARQASSERALQRREQMVQRQLEAAITQQDDRLKKYSQS